MFIDSEKFITVENYLKTGSFKQAATNFGEKNPKHDTVQAKQYQNGQKNLDRRVD